MNEIIKSIEAEQLKENAPQFNVGDTVKVYGKIKEGNRERIQVFEGTVLKKQRGGARATFTVSFSSLISSEMSSLIVSFSFSIGISFGSATAHATIISVSTITNGISSFLIILYS